MFLCSDTARLSTLLDYWRIVAELLLSGIHSMTRFSHMPFPQHTQLSSLCVTYHISLDSFLGVGAQVCVCGGELGASIAHKTGVVVLG